MPPRPRLELKTRLAGLLAVATVAAGLAALPGSALAQPGHPVPAGSGGPGTLITYRRLPSGGLDGTVYQVTYGSENEQGRDITVAGMIIVPRGPVPPGGFPVVSYAHPTTGLAPACAPSNHPPSDFAGTFVNRLLKHGFEFAASDMQPVGQTLPYLVGTVAARNVIDIVRAARHLPAAHAARRYAVWGHSEGGQAALFALKIAHGYAPGLRLTGVVASAPPSQLQYIYDHAGSLDRMDRAYWLMILYGFHVAYGTQAPLGQLLTPLGLSLRKTVETQCSVKALTAVDRYPLTRLVRRDPFTRPGWRKLLLANDPGQFRSASPAPLLILHGGDDTIVPPVTSQVLARHLCRIRQDVERWLYPGQSHAGVMHVYLADMIKWLSHRFAGDPSPDPMTPTGERGIMVTRCGS